jgi:hypothetical protein
MARLLLAAFVLAPLAQAQVADTIAAHRYVPLAVGNEWHYEDWRPPDAPPGVSPPAELYGYEAHAVIGEEIVDGQRCYEVERRFYLATPESARKASTTELVRFDEELDNVVSCTDESSVLAFYYVSPCPLSAALEADVECGDHPWVWVQGSHRTGDIGGESVEAVWKSFQSFGMESTHTVASDIGLVAFSFWDNELRLRYARVGDRKYGTPLTVEADESPPANSQPILTAYPNPTRAEVTVVFSLERGQEVTMSVFDILGRLILRQDIGTLPAGANEVRLDLAAVVRGVYVIRLVSEEGARAEVVITKAD